MEDQEKKDALTEVKLILDVEDLGHFTNNPDNHPIMRTMIKALLDEAQKFDIAKMDILTQAVITRFWHNIVKEPGDLLTDLKWTFAMGIVVGKAIEKESKGKLE